MAGAAKKEVPKAAKKEGRVIRLSKELDEHLAGLMRKKEGYDSLLRRYFGLPRRKDRTPQPLRTYFIVDSESSLIARKKISEARGDVILLAVRRGQRLSDKQKKDAVITVREVPQ